MNKRQFEELLKPLISIYDEIELDLIRNILNRIDIYDDIGGSLDWYLNKLADLGTFDKESLLLLKKNKKKIKEVLLDILNQAAANQNDFDRLDNFYQQGLLNVNPSTIYNSVAINNLVSEAMKDTDNIMELINTKAIEGTKEVYKNILNKAYLEASTGIYSYNESIRQALKEMADSGIQLAHYESGRKMSIESVVRRDVTTRVNKLIGDTEIQHAKELGTNLIYVDQHLGARVRTEYMKHNYEAHAEWQGKKYMIEGSSKEYPNLYETTGLGEMLGLKGINCYHDMRPTWEWEVIPEVIDEVENAIEYEKLQRKRKLERQSREIKRRKEIAKYMDDTNEFRRLNDRQKVFNEKYNAWLEENGLTRDYSREYVNKYSPDIIFKEEIFEEFGELDKKVEHFACYNVETGELIGNITHGTYNSVKPDVKTSLKMAFAKKDSLIAVHNHPKNTSFSIDDMITFNNTKSLYGIAVRTDNYIYTLTTGKNGKLNILISENKMKKIYSKIREQVLKENLQLIDRRHKINTLFAKEMGWKYGRVKNQK